MTERQKEEKSGANNLLIGVTVLGIFEILFGIIQSFDDIEFFRFMFIGGGCITLLPLLTSLIAVIYQKKTGEPLGKITLTNAKQSFSKFVSTKWKLKILEVVILSALIVGSTIGINYGIQESNRSLIVQDQFTLGNQIGFESHIIFEHENFINNEYRSLNLSMYAENTTQFKIYHSNVLIDEITVNGTETYYAKEDFTNLIIISIGDELREIEITVYGTPTQFYSLSLLTLLIITPWLTYTIIQIKKGKLVFRQIEDLVEEPDEDLVEEPDEDLVEEPDEDLVEEPSTKKYHPICFSCGQENLKNQQFCPSCGGKLSD